MRRKPCEAQSGYVEVIATCYLRQTTAILGSCHGRA